MLEKLVQIFALCQMKNQVIVIVEDDPGPQIEAIFRRERQYLLLQMRLVGWWSKQVDTLAD